VFADLASKVISSKAAALPSTDANRDHRMPFTATTALDQRVSQEPPATHAMRIADRMARPPGSRADTCAFRGRH
jgi:hypothetical protein